MINTLKKIQGTSSIITLVISAGIPADFPESLMQFRGTFDMEKADRLPKHSRYNCGFWTTMELVNINCPLYPHTAEEEVALNTWLDNMLKKVGCSKKPLPSPPLLYFQENQMDHSVLA